MWRHFQKLFLKEWWFRGKIFYTGVVLVIFGFLGHIFEHHLAVRGLELHTIFHGRQRVCGCGVGAKAKSIAESGSHSERKQY